METEQESKPDQDDRVSIWSTTKDTHVKFVVACALTSLIAGVVCVKSWTCSGNWVCLYDLLKELATALGLSVAATWAAFNGGEAVGIALEHVRRRMFAKGRIEGRKRMIAKIRNFANSNEERILRQDLLNLLDEEEQKRSWFSRLIPWGKKD